MVDINKVTKLVVQTILSDTITKFKDALIEEAKKAIKEEVKKAVKIEQRTVTNAIIKDVVVEAIHPSYVCSKCKKEKV